MQSEEEAVFDGNSYSPGHPWYYLHGAPVPMPKQIRERARASGYRGYRADEIAKADGQAEPMRSMKLRAIREEERSTLSNDLSQYRRIARALHCYHRNHGSVSCECRDVHQAAALKHNHIYNAFAHLITVEELLAVQRDLFD